MSDVWYPRLEALAKEFGDLVQATPTVTPAKREATFQVKSPVAAWFDERIVPFVRIYLSMFENQYYVKDLMVDDPIAHVRFPRFAAGATREASGQMHY